MNRRDEKGFTLIELMIVIAIIGILAAIAIPQFSAYRVRAFNAAALSDLKNAITAQEAYFVDSQTYKGVGDTLQPLGVHILQAQYGVQLSTDVRILINTADATTYNMHAWNLKAADGGGRVTYTVSTSGGGTIGKL
jgi:type IV pilus assembly protein PilA